MGLDDFTGFSDNIEKEIIEEAKNAIPFGISYLDDALGGIFRNDLITLSGYSGMGKTELAVNIASNAAKAGKNVYFFALEAGHLEIQKRILYKIASDLYFKDSQRISFHMRYRLMIENKIDPLFWNYFREAKSIAQKHFKTMKIRYRGFGEFTVKTLKDEWLAGDLEMFADLVVIDHINYFDFGAQSEYSGVSEAIKKIRDLVLLNNVPIILVTHLNRPDRKIKRVVPDLDDVHASSNIGKAATKAIFMSRTGSAIPKNNKMGCFLRAGKSRSDGSVANFIGAMAFDLQTNNYAKDYQLRRLIEFDTGSEVVKTEDLPYWAGNASDKFFAEYFGGDK